MICAVALVLLLDASGSIGASDWAAQLGGHAAALEAPEVTRAIERGPVAVGALAFAEGVAPLVGWAVLRDAAGARAYAAALRAAVRPFAGGTDIGGAIRAGVHALSGAPCQPEERVIDLVTDGEADAAGTLAARDAAHAAGVRINALGIGPAGAAEWLRAHAVTLGGFAMQVEDWSSFPRAILRKITLEVAAR